MVPVRNWMAVLSLLLAYAGIWHAFKAGWEKTGLALSGVVFIVLTGAILWSGLKFLILVFKAEYKPALQYLSWLLVSSGLILLLVLLLMGSTMEIST